MYVLVSSVQRLIIKSAGITALLCKTIEMATYLFLVLTELVTTMQLAIIHWQTQKF